MNSNIVVLNTVKLTGWVARQVARFRHAYACRQIRRRGIPQSVWQKTLNTYRFLPRHPRLRELSSLFLMRKEFFGARGLALTDDMAVAVAAQASMLLLGRSLLDEQINPHRAFDVMRDFDDSVGIVLHAGAMLAKGRRVDANGVVHEHTQALSGQAMMRGPITLSWQDVADSPFQAGQGSNVVVHEFAHVLDMQTGAADGAPPLPRDFAPFGVPFADGASASQAWATVMGFSFERFCNRLTAAQQLGEPLPLLNAYGASAPEEFFAVAVESYLINPRQFASELPELLPWFDALFQAHRWQLR